MFLRNKNLLTFSILLLSAIPSWGNQAFDDIQTAVLKQDYAFVRDNAQSFLATHPAKNEAAEVKNYLGLSLLRLGQIAEAREIFKNSIKEESTPKYRDQAYIGLFDSYYIEENYDEALKVAQKVLKISPRSDFITLIYLKLARANFRLAQWDKAKDFLDHIVREYPNSAEAHVAQQLLDEKQYFSVQVGAFVDRNLAEKLVGELQQKQQYVYIVETVDKDQKNFYRVRVGQFASLDQAQQLKQRMSQIGYPAEIYP